MKKLGLVFLSAVAIVSIAGCNMDKKSGEGKEENKTENKKRAKTKIASLSIDGGEYIVPRDEEASDGEGFLALQVTLKNETSKSLDISSEDIMLYDSKDSKIEALRLYPEEGSKIKFLSYEKISGGKSKTGYVVFPVDKKGKYKLHFEPMIFDVEKESEAVIVDVDASEFKDHSKEAEKAAAAFVDEVFLAKENKSYEKLIVNNKDEMIQNFDTSFAKTLKDSFYDYKPTDEEANAIGKVLRETNGKKGKVEYDLFYYTPDMAIILINVEAITFKEMKPAISDIEDQFSEQASNMSFDEKMKSAEKFAVEKLPEIIKNTPPVEVDSYGDGFKMTMKKDDAGKWEVQTKGTTSRYDNLLQAFRGNY